MARSFVERQLRRRSCQLANGRHHLQMKRFSSLIVLALCISAAFAASDVIDLDESNFDEVVGKSDGVFVEFFAPW
jgi:hypothetical protein